MSEHPNFDPRVRLEPSMFRTAVKRSNHLATRPCYIYVHICIFIILVTFLPLYQFRINANHRNERNQIHLHANFQVFSTLFLVVSPTWKLIAGIPGVITRYFCFSKILVFIEFNFKGHLVTVYVGLPSFPSPSWINSDSLKPDFVLVLNNTTLYLL